MPPAAALKHEGKHLYEARLVGEVFVYPAFGDIGGEALTEIMLKRRLTDLVQQPPRVRTKKGAEQNYRELPAMLNTTGSGATLQILVLARRALNQALAAGKINSAAWRHIKPFAKANAPRIHYLTVAEDSAKQFLTDLLGVGPLPQAPTSRRLRKLTGFLGARCSARRRSSKILAMKDGPMKECQRTWRWHLPQAGETASSLLPPSPPAEKATAANNRPGRPAPEWGRGRFGQLAIAVPNGKAC
jgi:hypothetical protein